jgi:hypothetical protein
VWIGQAGFEERVGRIAYIMVVVHIEEHHHAFHLWRTQNGQDVCKPLNHSFQCTPGGRMQKLSKPPGFFFN